MVSAEVSLVQAKFAMPSASTRYGKIVLDYQDFEGQELSS